MKNPIPTHPPRRTPSRSSRHASQAAAVLGSLALSALAGCGAPEPTDEVVPVRADEILDNDAPLGRLHEIKKGAIFDTLLPFEGTAGVILPSSFDVLSLEGPVRNQSHRGVCSIFSTIGLMEMLYKKAGMANPDFSEQYLQWAVKVQDHAFPDSEGSSDNYNLETINKFGIPAESAWPYDNYPWSTANDPACTGAEEGLPTKCYTNGEPSAAARSATKYKLPAGRSVSTSSIKNVIFEKKVGVVVGLDFFYQAWNHRLSTLPVNAVYFGKGYVLNPNAADIRESRKQPAGHSVQLVGWDDNLQIQQVDAAGKPVVDAMGKPVKEQGFYLFKNSWGTASFGVNNSKAAGYGWISYKYIASYGTANTSDPPTLRP